MLSYSLIKLLRSHDLLVGDIFTDKPQNRENDLYYLKFTDKIIDIGFLIENIIFEKSRWVISSLIALKSGKTTDKALISLIS